MQRRLYHHNNDVLARAVLQTVIHIVCLSIAFVCTTTTSMTSTTTTTTTTWMNSGILLVNGLSASNKQSTLKRPIVVLSNSNNKKKNTPDVAGFLYGKLQRATSIYGSELTAPTTALTNADPDLEEIRMSSSRSSGTNDSVDGDVAVGRKGRDQLQSLEKMLWKQFGMATCEGSVEREDLLWNGPSYLQPKLATLRDTIVFFDVTTSSSSPGGGNNNGGGAGAGAGGLLGGLFSSFLPLSSSNKKEERTNNKYDEGLAAATGKEKENKNGCWIDVKLIEATIAGGTTQVYVVCESDDTKYCVETLSSMMVTSGGSSITIVSPDDGIVLGDQSDKSWSSLRPQDLEGELSEPISIRNGSFDYGVTKTTPPTDFDIAADTSDGNAAADQNKKMKKNDTNDKDSSELSSSERRMAAAHDATLTAITTTRTTTAAAATMTQSKEQQQSSSFLEAPSSLSRHDLAEVCVQCALRLTTTTNNNDNDNSASSNKKIGIRVVRVSPACLTNNNNIEDYYYNDAEEECIVDTITERPNDDYFSRTSSAGGGTNNNNAKSKAGVVTSVDWKQTLQCMIVDENPTTTTTNNGSITSSSSVKTFPKRPDLQK